MEANMEQIKVIMDTDWVMFFATISSGILAAIATLIAVMISNQETRKQLKQQQEQHKRELEEQNRANKFVTIKPVIIVSSIYNLFEKIIIQNDYNRELFLSGADGFDFFDDQKKQQNQIWRILHIENASNNNILDVNINTESHLANRNTDEIIRYKTENIVKLLRSRESIDIRLANQEQFENIMRMKQNGIPNELKFKSTIEYSTEANQRIKYSYIVRILNDWQIEIEKDEIESIEDCENEDSKNATVFRNLQDYVTVNRAAYAWEKMGQSQTRGFMSLFNQFSTQQEIDSADSNSENKETKNNKELQQ